MKYLTAAAVLSLATAMTPLHAGNTETPQMETAIIVADTTAGSSSSAQAFVAMVGLFMVFVVAQ